MPAGLPACSVSSRAVGGLGAGTVIRKAGKGGRGVWGAGPLQARGFGGGAPPPCSPARPISFRINRVIGKGVCAGAALLHSL